MLRSKDITLPINVTLLIFIRLAASSSIKITEMDLDLKRFLYNNVFNALLN